MTIIGAGGTAPNQYAIAACDIFTNRSLNLSDIGLDAFFEVLCPFLKKVHINWSNSVERAHLNGGGRGNELTQWAGRRAGRTLEG